MRKIRMTESQFRYCIRQSILREDDDTIEVNTPNSDPNSNPNSNDINTGIKQCKEISQATGKNVEMQTTIGKDGQVVQEGMRCFTKKQLKEARARKLRNESYRVR